MGWDGIDGGYVDGGGDGMGWMDGYIDERRDNSMKSFFTTNSNKIQLFNSNYLF